MNKRIKNLFLKIILPLLAGALILFLIYRKTDLTAIMRQLKNLKIIYLLLSLVFISFGSIIRGIRWKLIFNSMGYRSSKSSLIFSSMGSYAISFLIPRAGEIWRCLAIAKKNNIPINKSISSILTDRAADVLFLLLIFGLCLGLNYPFIKSVYQKSPEMQSSISAIIHSYWIYAILFAFLIVLYLFFFSPLKKHSFVSKTREYIKTLILDMRNLFLMKERFPFIIWTILMWVSYFLSFYIPFFAFDFTQNINIIQGFLAFTICTASLSIPVQGGIGVWHIACIISLIIILGEKVRIDAAAFAGLVFSIQAVWMIVSGVAGILIIPQLKQIVQDKQKDFSNS